MAAGAAPFVVSLVDLNQDNVDDLTFRDTAGTSFTLRGTAEGTFQSDWGRTYAVNSGDADGDRIPDLLLADTSTLEKSILLGDGNGRYTPVSVSQIATSAASPPISPVTLSFLYEDVNGDAVNDIVFGDDTGVAALLLGSKDGRFVTETGREQSVYAFDLNADGNPDLVVNDVASGMATLLLGDATGHLTLVPPADIAPRPERALGSLSLEACAEAQYWTDQRSYNNPLVGGN